MTTTSKNAQSNDRERQAARSPTHAITHRGLWTALAVFAVMLLIRLGGIALLGQQRTLSYDEVDMTRSSMDRFLGVPSTSLAWPGTTLQMIAVPVIGIDFALHSHGHLSLGAFLDYLSVLERLPWHLLHIMQTIVAILVCAAFGLMYRVFLRAGGSPAFALAGVLLLATAPELWLRSQMAMGDAPAIAFACAAIFCLYRAELTAQDVVAAGLLVGLALASRLTALFLLPFLAGLLLWVSRRPFRDLFLFGLLIAAGFLFACPYVWTDPLRLARATLGNATRPGSRVGLVSALDMATYAASLLLLVLLPVAWISGLLSRRWWLVAGSFLTTAGVLFVSSRAAVVAPRYMLALAPAAVMSILVELESIRRALEKFTARKLRWLSAGMVILVAAQLSWNCFAYGREIRQTLRTVNPSQSTAAYDQIVTDLKDRGIQGPVYLSWDFYYFAMNYGSAGSLRKEAEAAELNDVGARSILPLMASRTTIPLDDILILAKDLDAPEQARVARQRLAARTASPGNLDIFLWDDDPLTNAFGWSSSEAAFNELGEGKADAVITGEPRNGWTATRTYGQGELRWYLYLRRRP